MERSATMTPTGYAGGWAGFAGACQRTNGNSLHWQTSRCKCGTPERTAAGQRPRHRTALPYAHTLSLSLSHTLSLTLSHTHIAQPIAVASQRLRGSTDSSSQSVECPSSRPPRIPDPAISQHQLWKHGSIDRQTDGCS